MRIPIHESVTPAQRSDPRFLRLHRECEAGFSSKESRHYKLLLGLHEVGHGYFARKSGATNIRYYGPCMTWDGPPYNCPAINRSSCGWIPNPNASVVAQMKAHIGGFIVRRELSDEPNEHISVEHDLQGAREWFDSNVGTGEEAFQKALEQAERDILEDLKDPNIVTEIWSEARRFVNDIFPPIPKTPKTKSIKLGRNSPCPCGSEKKYKRCCIDRINRIDRLVPDRLVPELVAT